MTPPENYFGDYLTYTFNLSSIALENNMFSHMTPGDSGGGVILIKDSRYLLVGLNSYLGPLNSGINNFGKIDPNNFIANLLYGLEFIKNNIY